MKSRLCTFAIALLLAISFVAPVQGAAGAPVFKNDNPTCADLAPEGANWFELKVDGDDVIDGTFTDGTLEVTLDFQDTSTGQVFDFTSNIGIDAVFVKGGNGGNLYQYDPPGPEVTSGTGLHAPLGAGPGGTKYSDVSHINFCYDLNVVVTKSAETSFTRTFVWTIDKSVVPATWNLFTGDSGTSEYTVAVTKDAGTDSAWAVEGEITIYNPAPSAATITGVTDAISGFGAVAVNCGAVTFPYALSAGGTLTCSYSTALPDGIDRTNTATVTTSGVIAGGSDTVDVDFGDPTTKVNDSINVVDTFKGALGSFSASGSISYSRTFTCDADEGDHDNTATIVETGQSDDASVTVTCNALVVTKDAVTSFDRTWAWTIKKSADQTELLLADGQLFHVNYEVEVNATSSDDGHAVTGDISVHNPATIEAVINSVSDLVSPAISAGVDCGGVTFPYTLAAGGTLECTYSTNLPDGNARTNTAAATLQNYNYDSAGSGTPSGTTDFTGTANVSFSNVPTDVTDDCIDVNDTLAGFLGTVCVDDPLPYTFSYVLSMGTDPDADVILVCGDNTVTNIADFVTDDTGATGSDDHTVIVTVNCELGCTLTQGYWKTHSINGPAPYDDTWAGMEDDPFFSSGKTWYEVLWTPVAGNAYYQLAHQYIAAELNILNGASVPSDVQTALASATTLFNTYTPTEIAALKGNDPVRKQFVTLAGILASYNEGTKGPGHCDEDSASASGLAGSTLFVPMIQN